jgi:hypothetical protein
VRFDDAAVVGIAVIGIAVFLNVALGLTIVQTVARGRALVQPSL